MNKRIRNGKNKRKIVAKTRGSNARRGSLLYLASRQMG